MVENFKHKSPSRRCLAIVCLGAAIQGMPQEDRRAMSLILEEADEKDVLAAAKKLIPMIWKKGSERPVKKKGGDTEADGVRIELPPPLQELLVRLALLLAWQDVAGADIWKNIETVRAGETVHADVMIEGLKATEEFYRDRLEDVLRRHGIGGNQIPFIRKHRRLLAAEVERIERVETEKVKVEFIPSCSQIDFFFNRIGEDCAFAESFYRSDFQLYRMIVGNNLVGMLYLQKAILGGKKALVLAIQPRASWQADHAGLLAVVRDGLSQIANKKDYDYLLMMNAVNQQSNRQGMLKAIEAAKFRAIAFEARKTVSAARRERIIAERLHGADIQRLGPIVERLSGLLSWGLEHLLQQEFDEALEIFKEADRTVTEFRAVMNEIAATVGLEIDPVTGEVKEKK